MTYDSKRLSMAVCLSLTRSIANWLYHSPLLPMDCIGIALVLSIIPNSIVKRNGTNVANGRDHVLLLIFEIFQSLLSTGVTKVDIMLVFRKLLQHDVDI